MLWPEKGDVAFGKGKADGFRDPTVTYVDWLLNNIHDGYQSDAFREAADLVIESLADGKVSFGYDKFFFPIAYLYRHAIELSLKDCLGQARQLGLVKEDDTYSEVMASHNLEAIPKPRIETMLLIGKSNVHNATYRFSS
jgi:hypothetical protein